MSTFKKDTQKKYTKQVNERLESLPNYVKKYIDFIRLSTSAYTQMAYLWDITAFLSYVEDVKGDTSLSTLDSLTADEINAWLNYMSEYEKDGKEIKNENVSLRRKLSSIRRLYDYLFTQELIEHNPARRVQVPKVPRKNVIRMDKEEVKELMDTVQYGRKLTKMEEAYHDRYGFRDFTLLSLTLGTGIRVSEVVGLNIDDVSISKKAIRIVRKGGKEDIVYFSDKIAEILSDYLTLYRKAQVPVEGHEKALFLSSQRKRMTIRSVQRTVKKYVEHTELLKHITPHKLRSTYGTELYQTTNDLYLVASVLGHESVETTKIYVQQALHRKEQVRNAVDYNEDNKE